MVNYKNETPELIAPAGNLEKMKTAFAFGADAVYLGIPDFSLRVRINDFDMPGIKRAIAYAHDLGKKAYVTINIFAHNQHIKKLLIHIRELKRINPDGVFISDPGVLLLIKKYWPKAKIILSTQANCTNSAAARFWQKQGVSRVILARELSLKEIIAIRQAAAGLETECFIHGALCMAYSGRCFLSKYYNGRDANLGDCVQPCRWEYTRQESQEVKKNETIELEEDKHGSYVLNSNDLCLIKKLPELIGAGIDAFKIEGRAKSVYYLANVVGAYRRAIDLITLGQKHRAKYIKKELEFLYKELESKLFHRGFTEGFMFSAGKLAQNLENSHDYSEWEFCGQVIAAKTEEQYSLRTIKVKVHNTLKTGDRVEILSPDYVIMKMKLKEMISTKTGKKVKVAHGGGSEDVVLFEANKAVPEYSVVRRKIYNT